MNTTEEILGMIATEALSPDTHMCHTCGRTFSPNEDGCPFCDTNAPVSLVPELHKKEE
jgi:rubrerythrin